VFSNPLKLLASVEGRARLTELRVGKGKAKAGRYNVDGCHGQGPTFRDVQTCRYLHTSNMCAMIKISMIVAVVVGVVVGNVLSGSGDGVSSAKVGTCQGVPTTVTIVWMPPSHIRLLNLLGNAPVRHRVHVLSANS
jgi:hypothetical protein